MNHPSTEENSAEISPRLCMTALQCNHNLALASLWPPHAQVYQQESSGTQEPHLPVDTQKCLCLKLAMRWMDPRAFIWQFCSSAERKTRPHIPSAVLARRMRSTYMVSKQPLAKHIFIFRHCKLKCRNALVQFPQSL